MENTSPKTEIDATERATIFHEQYGNEIDAADALPEFVIAAGNYISRIVGDEATDAGMAVIIKSLVETAGKELANPSEWRSALDDARANCFSEWRIGPQLHDLWAYAEYGIALHDSDDPDELALHIKGLLTQAQDLLAETPIVQWRLRADNVLVELVSLATNRWALDNGEPIEPAALAHFGDVSEGRIRNMASGADRTFSLKDGKISAADALKWLAGRPQFWNSIWRVQRLTGYASVSHDPIRQAAFVPVARDGSTFHPGLRRGKSYTIGKKGEEEQVDGFDEALAKLQRMPVPHWRRPNAKLNWGTVAGVRWQRVDLAAHIPADKTPRALAADSDV